MKVWSVCVLLAAAEACPGGVISRSQEGMLSYYSSGVQASVGLAGDPYCDGKIPEAACVWPGSTWTLDAVTMKEKFILPEWDRQALASIVVTAFANDYVIVKVNGVEVPPRGYKSVTNYSVLQYMVGSNDDLGWHDNVIEIIGNNTLYYGSLAYIIKYSY